MLQKRVYGTHGISIVIGTTAAFAQAQNHLPHNKAFQLVLISLSNDHAVWPRNYTPLCCPNLLYLAALVPSEQTAGACKNNCNSCAKLGSQHHRSSLHRMLSYQQCFTDMQTLRLPTICAEPSAHSVLATAFLAVLTI